MDTLNPPHPFPTSHHRHSNFVPCFSNAALEGYKRKTKKDLASHPLLPRLESCDSPEAVLTVLREQIPGFSESQNGDDGLTKWVTPTVNVLYAFSDTLGQGIGLVKYQDIFFANHLPLMILSGIPIGECNLCGDRRSPLGKCPSCCPNATYFDAQASQTAKDASSSRDKLIEIFNRIERFFHRLEIYTGITPTASMRDIIIEIMVEVLTILAIATKEVKRGRLSRSILHGFTILD
jgi:hypothetical protein